MNIKAFLLTSILLLSAAHPALASAGDVDYEKGVAYLRAGKTAEALKVLEPLVASRGKDPYLRYHLGIAYYSCGRLDEAYTAFKTTRELSEDGSDEFRLDTAFSNLGVEFYRAGDYDKAVAALSDALDIDPDDGDSRYYLGLAKMEKADYYVAEGELKKARDLLEDDDEKSSAVQNALALVYYRMGEPEAALEEFKTALKLDPDNIEALYYLGQISYKEQGYAAAKPYFDRIVHAGAPDEKTREALFTTFFNMGVDFQDRGKSDAATEMFERAAELKPGDAETHYYIGYNLMALERYEDAVLEFKQALSLDPGLARATTQMEVAGRFASEKALSEAESLMSDGDFYAALPLYEKAASLDPSSEAARKGLEKAGNAVSKDKSERVARARDLLARGEYMAAMEESEQLSRLDPGSTEAASLEKDITSRLSNATQGLLEKASRAEDGKRLGEAVRLYSAVLDMDPKNAAAKKGFNRTNTVVAQTRRRAAKAAEQGLLKNALDAYRELVGYLPDDAGARAGLKAAEDAVVLELAKRLNDARESFGLEDYTMAAYHAGRALELDPGNSAAEELREKIRDRSRELVIKYVREGDSLLTEGLREKASESYESALLLDPGNAGAKTGLEKSRAALSPSGNQEEVRRLYLKGVEHYTKGQLDQAVTAWKEVLSIDPGNEKALSSIRRAEEKMKQTEDTASQPE